MHCIIEEMKIYNKYKRLIEYGLYPLALLILPLMKFNLGVDVSDSTYSLGNYLFADRLEGMWVISTYLSNVVGSFIMKLPGAHTLRGANVYTGLLLVAIGLMVYFVLSKDIEAKYVFLGEFVAISFCWIPTGILYNYLSYFVMAAGALLLYKGITKQSWKYLLAAGFALGLNVFVRIPNVTQMALIVALWFVCFVTGRKWFKDTCICVGGYAAGVAVPGIVILVKYGINGILDMISGLSGITSTDETYTPISMITGPLKAYVRSAKWLALAILVVVCGIVMFKILPEHFRAIKTVIYVGVIALMLRFFWGRGMFSFRYYEDYTSMYEWGVFALYLSIAADIYVIVKAVVSRKHGENVTKQAEVAKKLGENITKQEVANDIELSKAMVLAVISLVIIAIAPLGSNNNLYQNLNNLFMVMPFTMYVVFGWIKNVWAKKNAISVPMAVMLYALLACISVQSFGFSQNFVFRDGMRGEKRDTCITGVKSLEGMYTNAANAKALTELCKYMEKMDEQEHFEEMILFGDCPGLTFILNKPSALFSSWIDLDSNPSSQIEKELNELAQNGSRVPVIIRKVEGSAVAYEQKKALVENYIEQGGYQLSYDNEQYSVYTR